VDSSKIDLSKINIFVYEIIQFYTNYKADFIWRKLESVWQILLTEIILQKTNASKVANFINEFLRKCNTPYNTLTVPTEELKFILKPFGMSTVKAVRIKTIAEIVVNKWGGVVPCDKEQLMQLPGVGDYISDAVMCFGFGCDRAVVDVNTIRVITRYFGIQSNFARPRYDKKLYSFIQSLVPEGKCKEFNWGIIDLSHYVCRGNPKCLNCVIKEHCSFFNNFSTILI